MTYDEARDNLTSSHPLLKPISILILTLINDIFNLAIMLHALGVPPIPLDDEPSE